MNVIAEIQRINERELENGIGYEASWHQKYSDSAWIYIGMCLCRIGHLPRIKRTTR